MPTFKAVFFDVDGTLLDSKGCIAEVASKTFKDIGAGEVEPGYFLGLLKKGLGVRYHLTDVAKRPELYGKATETFARNYADAIGRIRPFDGVEELLLTLREDGIRTGIFTAQHEQLMKLNLERFRLPVDAAISRDDVEKGKPAPDQVRLLCERLSVTPKSALSVGDWTGDIEAGKGAGTKTAGVLTGLCSREELEKKDPDYIFERVTEIMEIVR